MKKVLITGASGGIGSSTVYKFINNGYTVVGIYNSDELSIENIKNTLREKNLSENFFAYKCDFSMEQSVLNAISEINKSFKYFDVIVNNAGISLFKQITDTTIEEWNRIFDINTKSMFMMTNAVLPSMIERKCGKIINISSIWGVSGASCEVAYSASKSAVIGYTKALAKEVGYSGICVNCVCPGVIDTKMNSRLNSDDIKDICQNTPIGRLGTPNEVSELIFYLASEKADFITGQVITIDGGFTL